MWKCDRCGKLFQHYLHVAQHRRIHSEYRLYKCHFGQCLQAYHNLSELQEHGRSHIDHRRYCCRICQVQFLKKVHLEHHKCRPHVRHVHKCHVCSATFPRIISLAIHIYEHHPRVVKLRHLQCREHWRTSQGRNKTNKTNVDDSKILLKISLGKSMTIISPSKQSPCSNESNKKLTKKKSKKKHRKEDKKTERKGIILSIKKGMVNVKDKRIEVSASKQKLVEKSCGQSNTEYKVGEQKSELKLTIKACPDLNLNTGKGETYKVLERSDSKSSLKLEKRSSSRTEIDKLDGRETDDLRPSILKDSSESKVRNGVVITKDKSGKFLAEQLQSVKLKKRDNVFESFNDVGIWKVLGSPRDRPNDILKLKLSPQKPARIESTLEEACAFNAAKYLDIPVDSVKVKGEASGEDSDVMELLPPYDKENDGGMNNVNDSGIEVLSSSSCNRSNGNSVRSVVNEDNSPTYFNTEDSMFSLDSPITEVVNKSEHSICRKCGGIIMETNNNAQSPGKCRCNTSDQTSFEMPESPVKINLISPEMKNDGDAISEQSEDSKHKRLKDDKGNTVTGQNSEIASFPDNEKSDGEDSDVVIITFDKCQTSNTEESRNKLRLKLRPKDPAKSPLASPQKGKRSSLISPLKTEKPECATSIKLESVKTDKASYAESEPDNDKSEQNKLLCGSTADHSSNSTRKQTGKNSTLCAYSPINSKLNLIQFRKDNKSDNVPAVIMIDEDDDNDSWKKQTTLSVSSSETKETSKQIKKRPLFKSKKSANKDITNSSPSLQSSENQLKPKEMQCLSKEDKTVHNKKPLFKKRNLSADGNTENRVKKPCFKTQMSVPGNSTREIEVKQNNNSDELLMMGENVPCTKSVTKLCTVGLEDDDSLQDLSGEIIDDGDKLGSPVEKAQKPAISFDLYQQQFLSFLSNTINSSKSSTNNHSDKTTESKQEDDKIGILEKSRNTTSRSSTETGKSEKICTSSDKTVSDQTSAENKGDKYERNAKLRHVRESGNVQDNKVRHQSVRQTRQLSKNKEIKCAGIAEFQGTESRKGDKTNKMNEETKYTSEKNRSVIKLEIPELQRSAVELGECYLDGNDINKEELDTESRISGNLKNKPCMESKSCKGIKTEAETENMVSLSAAGGIGKNVSMAGNENTGTIEKSDSFSWLSIFGEKSVNENTQKNKKDSTADVMTDLSENLAEINKKIDVSEDDDTHSLDVDDVFQLDNLSSLEPKHEINFSTSNKVAQGKPVESENGNGPYKRKQTAKRTVGKFKAAKRTVESELEYSDESSDAETIDLVSSHPDSDPDFNPFMDSDDDFVKGPEKQRWSRTCVRSKKRMLNGNESLDSDNESKCSETDRLDSESQSSRSRRTKMGRKSCCPCCIGSPGKRSRDHPGDQDTADIHKETYKLPRKHKQFVRSTLKLLQLQEKIHTLFLTLFPECTEIITRSNIGTEEFESLIDDVLSGLEENEVPYSSTVHSVGYMKKDLAQSQFGSCPANNIEMPFTAPGSATRTSEIDLINTSGEDNSCPGASIVQTGEHNSQNDLVTSSVHKMENKFDENTAGKEIDAGISWQQTTLFSQSTLMAPTSSSSSLKFENNTITDNDEPIEENIYDGMTSYPSESSLSFPQESVVTTVNAHYNVNDVDMMNVGEVTHLNLLNHSETFNGMEYLPSEVSSVPVVQSEITITLDLNAVRVSLCRTPKSCLEKLQNRIIKLTKYFLPKLEFKNYFYKNIDNLEFLLDLMIEANTGNRTVDRESENEFAEESITEKWHIPSDDIEIIEAPIIMEDDTVKVNFLSIKNDSKIEEREPLFVKCSELFEQEIKSQRESLKKAVFCLEEDRAEDTWKSAEEVLSSINSLKKMARRTQMAQRTRRPRESRLRKRSAEEKRTLFVQEKLQNSQNSTFVCNTRTRSGNKVRAGRKASQPQNLKKRFLSELNLGDTLITNDTDNDKECVEKISEKMNGHVIAVDTKKDEKKSSKADNVMFGDTISSKTEKMVILEKCKEIDAVEVAEDPEFLLKGADKNIFELMQPP